VSVHGGLVILVDDQPKRTVRVQLAHGTSSNDRSTGIIWILLWVGTSATDVVDGRPNNWAAPGIREPSHYADLSISTVGRLGVGRTQR
jgi:hypothetical protein